MFKAICPDLSCVHVEQKGSHCAYCGEKLMMQPQGKGEDIPTSSGSLSHIPAYRAYWAQDQARALAAIPKPSRFQKLNPFSSPPQIDPDTQTSLNIGEAHQNILQHQTIYPEAIRNQLIQFEEDERYCLDSMQAQKALKKEHDLQRTPLKLAHLQSLKPPVSAPSIPGARSQARLARLQTRMQYAKPAEVPGLQQKSNRLAKEMTLRKAIAETNSQIEQLATQLFQQPSPDLQRQLAVLRNQQEELFAALAALQKPSVGFQGLPDEMAAAPFFPQESAAAAAGAGFQG